MKKILITFLCLLTIYPLLAIDLIVEIQNRKSDQSEILCGIYISQEGFPTEPSKRLLGTTGSKEGTKTICRFKELSPKTYSVSVLEDLNGNKKMDSTFVGFPKEPWGVSQNAPMHTFGPPTFAEASFNLEKNKTIQIKLNIPE